MEVDRRGRRNHDDSMCSSSEDSVRTRKQEAAVDVSMQDTEQTEQTETEALSRRRQIALSATSSRRLSRWEQALGNPSRGRPSSRTARTPRKRTQAGAATLLRQMKNLESAIKGVNSHTSKALGEIKQTSCWHHALTDDAGRPLQYPNGSGQQSCRHGGGEGYLPDS